MIRNLTIVFCFLSIITQAQTNITGTVRDSASGEIVPFATVYYAQYDSTLVGTTADINGNYSLKIIHGGNIELIAKSLNASDTISAHIIKDTIINFKIVRRPEYQQPCRIQLSKNNIVIDLPTNSIEIEDYKRIQIESKKLGLISVPELQDSFFARIWVEPAFDYYGGYVYEFHQTQYSWICEKVDYSCNHFQFRDSIDLANPELTDEIDDSTFYSLLTFTIKNKEKKVPNSGWRDFNKKNYFEKIMNEEDFCKTMLNGDRHLCCDGMNYHIELKIGDKYKFISFYNPGKEYIEYKQIALFLELIKYIEENFIPVE